jgi:hypothetical protein
LLKAGREILSQTHIDENYFNTRKGNNLVHGTSPIPEEIRLHQIFLDIGPRKIVIHSDGYLLMEMHGGMDHFGFNIYPDYFREPYSDYKYGDRELVPGLWYYDDGYLYNPDYDKRINLLIEKHKGK